MGINLPVPSHSRIRGRREHAEGLKGIEATETMSKHYSFLYNLAKTKLNVFVHTVLLDSQQKSHILD